MSFNSFQVAKNVIDCEITGLKALRESFSENFNSLIEIISSIEGRVIFSGMGKSGIIARKIASTLSSTGTPSYFLHPGEASHGDLGILTPKDAIILLSNSGNTFELRDIITYAHYLSIPIFCVVRQKKSILVQQSKIAFVLPDSPETSHTGAPTTSTTMMLVWGDCLAMALCEKKGFTQEDFGMIHPGGKLGERFRKVGDIMRQGKENLPLCTIEDSVKIAVLQMTKYRLGCCVICNDNNQVIGIITDGDLRRNMNDQIFLKTTNDIMTHSPLTVPKGLLATKALHFMREKSIQVLPVVAEDKCLEGIISIYHLLD